MEEEIIIIEDDDIEEIEIEEENYSGKPYELPIASADVLGGIKVGENLTIDEDGTLNATGEITGEYKEIDPTVPAHVKAITEKQIAKWDNGTGNVDLTDYAKKTDVPTKTSQLTNDSNFINSIKTINGQSLLGEGDIEISGGSGTGDVSKDEIYYKKGDVFTTSYPITIGGLITSSTTRIIFCVISPKRLDNITKITCTSLKAELRGASGYLNNAGGYKEYATDSDYVITCSKVNGNTIEVYLTKSSAFTNINNNTFVVVRSYLGFEFE